MEIVEKMDEGDFNWEDEEYIKGAGVKDVPQQHHVPKDPHKS